MFVFTRKVGQRIVLPGSQAAITVVGVQGTVVRLGITAPDDVAVQRIEQRRQGSTCGDAPKSEVDSSAPMPIRVLIADPDESLWSHYLGLAEGRHVAIRMATDATNCVQQLLDFRPHLLVMDCELPSSPLANRLNELRDRRESWRESLQERRGCDLVMYAMRERPDVPVTPVVLLSDISDQAYEETAIPIIDRVQKPVTTEQLEEGICSLFAYRGWKARLNRQQSGFEEPVMSAAVPT